MPNKRTSSKNRQFNRMLFILTVTLAVCFALYIAFFADTSDTAQAPAASNEAAGTEMSVMVIDVGQADSILIAFGSDDVMLIDAGEQKDAAAIKEELDERGITQIDVLVATHPHADHIGGMKQIIDSYEVGSVYMPDMTSDSKTYRELKAAIKERGIPLTVAFAGETFNLGPAACTIVSPDKNADIDANNESVMLMVDYMDTEFLFTGDAEKRAEEEAMEAGYFIDADVLKVGHHGSHTGTSEEFLKAVSPDFAVISCGKDNDYGHPHKETLMLLDKYGIDTLRTDISGDILFVSDGHTLKTVFGD